MKLTKTVLPLALISAKFSQLAMLVFMLLLGIGAPGVNAQVYSFSTCGQDGPLGPDQTLCNAEYSGGTLDSAVTVTGGVQNWTVPASGTYLITAIGGGGSDGGSAFSGGAGAQIQAELVLLAGETIQLVVGQLGRGPTAKNGGGGGGSFVVDSANMPLLIAGGGGAVEINAMSNGCNASVTAFGIEGSGVSLTSSCILKAIDSGQGGSLSFVDEGSAGAGFFSEGASNINGKGGASWANGMLGGIGSGNAVAQTHSDGGFGGGGSGYWGAGGGGGYSGGDSGAIAGGGGSFVVAGAANIVSAVAGSVSDGSITLQVQSLLPEAAPAAVPALPGYALLLTVLGVLLLALYSFSVSGRYTSRL